jgi:hypothetical protein
MVPHDRLHRADIERVGIVDLPGLDQFLRRARDAKRARDVVGGTKR